MDKPADQLFELLKGSQGSSSFAGSRSFEREEDAACAQPTATIADYGLIGDCRTAALVSSAGSIDWLCFPNFSDPSIFSKLLDPAGGQFSICPVEPFTSTRRYVGDTAVLETTFKTSSGTARVIDCLPVLDGIEQMRPLRELLRVIEGIEGTVEFQAAIDPRPDYARLRVAPRQRGRLGWFYSWGNELLNVLASFDLDAKEDALRGDYLVSEGQREYISLSYTCGEPAILTQLGEDADLRLTETTSWWSDWSKQVTYDGEYKEAVQRSAITLKLLSFALSGAVIAAPTTSLPETIGGKRNWDYRYCWLRDAGLTVQAMLGVGIREDAEAFLDWMLHATRLTWPKLQVMYDLYGRTELDEYELPHLEGYMRSRPVRIGNGASIQKQLDIYGEVILAADTFALDGGTISAASTRMLAGLGKVILKTWREPDNGIWEMRGPRRQFTFSKVMCWCALDRLVRLHERGVISLGKDLDVYQQERVTIAELIEARGFNSSTGTYTAELDGDRVDSSVLLIPSVGYKRADDPRMKSTYAVIRERLEHNGLLQRYQPDPDDKRPPEGAFGICCFWAVDQVAQSGEYGRAKKQFEHLLSFGNDLGLFAEEIESRTGEALGNFPQGFTHVGLINAAIAIERSRRAMSEVNKPS